MESRVIGKRVAALFSSLSLAAVVACSGSSSSAGASPETVCQKLNGLSCAPSSCASELHTEQSSCGGAHAADYQAYLDCLQAASFDCEGAPARPHTTSCLAEASKVIACASGGGGGNGGGGDAGGGGGGGKAPGASCSGASDCAAITCSCKDGSPVATRSCTNHVCDDVAATCSSNDASLAQLCADHGGV